MKMIATLQVILLLSFVLSFAAESAELEHSQILPLAAELQKGMPWFAARTRDATKPFTKKDLESLVGQQTKRVALVFFASWCIPCREGVIRLRDNQAELDKNGMLVVLVNVGETELPKIENWIKTNGNEKWPVILDKFKSLSQKTGLISDLDTEFIFPKTILLDNQLKPVLLIGAEGKDWPRVLWEYNLAK